MPKRWRLPLASPRAFVPALTLILWPIAPTQGQPPMPEAAPAKAEEKPGAPNSLGWDYEEEVTRTREDLENLQRWLTAKRAQLKAAEFSSNAERKLQSEYDRLQKKGMASSLHRELADLEVLEADSQRAVLQAEIGDLQTRHNRTKRYLARLEQYGTAAMKSPDDHALELTEILTRLQNAERTISKLQEELKDAKSDLRAKSR
jgi:hypothetical protein